MGYQPKMVLRAIERVLMKKEKSEKLTGVIIMTALLSIEEEEEGMKNQQQQFSSYSGSGDEDAARVASKNSGSTNSITSKDLPGNIESTGGNTVGVAVNFPDDSDIKKYLLKDAAQSVLEMGYQPKMVLQAIKKVLLKKGTEQLTAANIMEAVLDIEDENEFQSKIQSPSTQPSIGNESSEKGNEASGTAQYEKLQIDPEKIMREHRELREATLCKICLDNTSSIVLLPCGHLVACPDCAPAMRKCPICRTLVKATAKAFYG